MTATSILKAEIEQLRWEYSCISAYIPVPIDEDWLECPSCNRKPRVWVFDNGRYARCQCGYKYDPCKVSAQSIWECHNLNNGDVSGYDKDALRKAWNEYVLWQAPSITPEEASLARVLAAAEVEDPHDGDSFED